MGAAAAKMERAMFDDDDVFLNHELYQDMPAQTNVPQSTVNNRLTGTNIQTKYPGIQDWIQENQKYLNQIIQNSNDDHVKIKVKEFLQLLQSGTPTQTPPVNYITSNATYTAEAVDDAVKFSCKFQINLLKIGWTVVPLFTDAVALAQSNVSFKPSNAALNLNQATRDVPLAPKGATYSYCIGVVQKCFALIAFYPGVYNVEMDVLVPYSSSRKTGLVVALPKASSNHLTFRIKGKDILIKVDPALFSKHTSDGNVSVVECEFPPTSQLSVQWTENMGLSLSEPSEKVDQKVEVSATAEQQSLVSIGEGVLSIKTLVSYKIVSGQMSLFEIEIDDRIKVLHVEGLKHIPVKKWSVISNKKDKNNNNEENLLSFTDDSERKLAPNKSLLKVWLEYGLEDMYEFTVISELEMTGTSCQVTIPCFNCITKEVSRDRGFIGVEARTNVEIEEIECKSVEVIDISELPDSVFVMASNPLLFGYKFLEPPYHIVLDVKKHADVSVLIAVVESALYSVTYSEEGSLLYKFVFSVRNTQKQYLRVGIPKEAEIWTTLVQGSPVKPALDEKGLVMIPLEKASKSGQADHSFTIEFVYHLKGEPMEKKKSHLDIEFPSCDIPINHLFVAVYLPEDYDYGEFTGMDEVKYWSRSPPSGNAAAPVQQANRQHRRGVMPVRVDVPTSGSRFMFEQLLFAEKNIELSVPYKKRGKGCCGGKRKTQRTGCCC